MNIRVIHFMMALLAISMLGLTGCSDDEDTLPPFSVNFRNVELGVSSDNPQADLMLTFSRPATVSGSISLALEPGDLNYGETADFYTSEVPTNNLITLHFEPGDQRAGLTIFAGSARDLEQDKTLLITIQDNSNTIFATGETSQVTVVFTENFLSPGGSLSASVGSEFDQRAYFDLSKASSSAVAADNYDLGFHSGKGFYVTLNPSAKVMARPLDKNDLNTVSAADTTGFFAVMKVPEPNFDPFTGSVAWIDTPDGNLGTTAFGEIEAIDEDNPVFIIKRDQGNWKKVRVLRDINGYTLQYADINAVNFETLSIAKDPAFEAFTVELDQGIVSATPENDGWDFMYSKHTEILNVGGSGADIPYEFKDYITINREDVSVSVIMTADIAYASFGASDLNGLVLDDKTNAIGSSWRQGGGPGTLPALFKDRFYVIKDGEGNTFKLQFTGMYGDNDERGVLSFTYELLN